jgi:hypothetical protein
MRIFIGLILIIFFTLACSNSSQLNKEFGCKTSQVNNMEKETDFFENYSVKIPNTWKKSFYYDDLQSEIFVADTTKVFEDTYILEFSMLNGKMEANEVFKKMVYQKANATQLEKIKDNFISFKGKKGYYFYGKGKIQQVELHVFQYYLQINDKQYFMAKSEIYGNEKVKERLCESIQIFNSLDFKKI